MPEIAYVNGEFGPVADAKVSIEDRGYQFGDGIYEVLVAYGDGIFLLEPHIQRMRRSAATIRIDYDFDAAPLDPIITEGLKRSAFSQTMIYVQLTRGVAPRSHEIPQGMTPTLVMTFKPLTPWPDELRRNGVKIMTVPDVRWANCFVKAITLLPNILAKHEAAAQGFDDALFVSPEGEVRECTSANVFVVKNGRLRFPPRTHSVLHGITQGFLLECAEAIDVAADERAISLDTLRDADEVFMSSTRVDVLGITQIDDRPVGDGRVGPVTQALYRQFSERIQANLTRPRLR